MKVYCGRNRKGKWKASLNRDNISKFQDIFETDVPQINGNRVWMIKLYKGFDYNYTSGTMYDDIAYSHRLYHSVSAAKKTELWKEYLKIAKTDPKNHFISDFCIASNDGMDQPFIYGDIMEGKFNIEIFPVNVISDKTV